MVPDAGGTMKNKTDVTLDLIEFICQRERQAKTKQMDTLSTSRVAEIGNCDSQMYSESSGKSTRLTQPGTQPGPG